MKPTTCQKCGGVDRVRKVNRKNLYWCWNCRQERLVTGGRKPIIHKRIESSRQAFEFRKQHSGTIASFSFEELLEIFRNDCLKFSEIGKQFGVSRERIRQIYQHYFSQVIPRRPNGRVREKVCTLKKRSVKALDFFQDKRFSSLLERVAQEEIEAKPARTQNGYSPSSFFLN